MQYVETGYLEYILSYKMSQDHLEILFSCFRAMGGYNNNPNCKQFMSSCKRFIIEEYIEEHIEELLSHNEV